MKHLTDDELIELYYGEAAGGAAAHEQACRECSGRLAELRHSLDAIRPEPAERRGADYGERVWKSLQPRLISHHKKPAGWRLRGQWRAALIALSCALLLAGAFLGGRHWERMTTKAFHTTGDARNDATRRVVLVVLADHLDRSERLLTALEHADPSDRAETAQIQSAARQLLSSNRLYTVTASRTDDPLLSGALDQLEGVLAEVANDPELTPADLRRLRSEMNAEGVLFEIRVLMARQPSQAGRPNHEKGASI